MPLNSYFAFDIQSGILTLWNSNVLFPKKNVRFKEKFDQSRIKQIIIGFAHKYSLGWVY